MSLPIVLITLGLPLLVTGLFPNKLRLPVRVSSLPPGAPLPPIAYMYVEDVVAVDGGGMQSFRQAWRTRYEESRIIRRVIRDVSIGWGASGIICGSALLAIIWTVAVDPGYGVAYGIPWIWALTCSICTIVFVRRELKREHAEWVAPKVHKEHILPIEEGKYDKPNLDVMRRRSTQVDRARGTRHESAPAGLGSSSGSGSSTSPASSPNMKVASAPRPPSPAHIEQVRSLPTYN
jgi:hypothetical protein